MKISLKSDAECILLTKNAKEYNSNGRVGVSYSLGVMCDNQLCELKCSENAYKTASNLGQYSPVVMHCYFDSTYNKFFVIDLSAVGGKSH